jgi:hypothetical protein
MANNYTFCAHVIDDVTEKEWEWIEVRRDPDWWEENHEEGFMGFEMIRDDDFLRIQSENAAPDQITWFVRNFLHEFRPDHHEIVEFAHTCDSLRAGEFGGSAVLVTATREVWFSPYELAKQMIAGQELKPFEEDYSTTVDKMKESIG